MATPRWEAHKENIQPRPRGRNAKLLEKALVGSKEDIEAERARREKAVKDAVARQEPARNLLDFYLAYALFIVDYFPAGSKHLVQAVEDPCRRHAKDENFRDDIRFLRLWILYIEMRRDKLDAFTYMRRKRIGCSWTLFYEAWAATLEAARQYDEVEKVYQLAREVVSRPQDRIAQRLKEFECRMAARKKRDQKKKLDAETKKIDDAQREAARKERNTARAEPSLASAILSAPVADENDDERVRKSTRVRPALGRISEHEAATGLRPFTSRTPSSSTREYQHQQSNHVQKQVQENKENKFQIYSDHSAPSPTSKPTSGEDQDLRFDVLAKIDDVGKEDRGRLPSQWAGETIPQNDAAVEKLKNKSLTSRLVSPFQIYQDENYQRGGSSPGEDVLGMPTSSIANNESSNDNENLPVASPEASRREPSPVFDQKAERYNRPPSPTINTKIAMREIDDMFNCSFPNVSEANFSRPPPLSLENERPGTSTAFKILPDEESVEQLRYAEKRRASPVPDSQSDPCRYDEMELGRYLNTWAVDQPSFQFIGDVHVNIEPDSILELPWRVPVTLCVQESQCPGFNQQSRVFFVEDVDNEFGGADISLSCTGDIDDVPLFVLKQSYASNIWEFYIYQTIQQRFQKKLMQSDSIPLAVGFSHGTETSFLVLDTKGVACLTKILQMMPRNVLPESLAMFLTVELLKTLCMLHEIDIIHSDITLDNVLFRRNTAVELVGDSYNASGEKGWSACGVLLVDFNASIDVLHKRVGGAGVDDVMRYTSTCNHSLLDPQYRPHSSAGWAFNVDCYGAAVCAAKMLGVKLNDTDSGPVPLKQEDIWKSFFEDMLRLEPSSTSVQTVKVMRRNYESMERVLEQDTKLGFEVGKLFRVVAYSLEADTYTTKRI
ncbi:Mitotic spindle checkpoint protein Bub1/Mad3 [Gracilaria domingensis]|nr:Mitotic spindle checkpoint protein Bub1/Mad3 [Gracilaria domingensis]